MLNRVTCNCTAKICDFKYTTHPKYNQLSFEVTQDSNRNIAKNYLLTFSFNSVDELFDVLTKLLATYTNLSYQELCETELPAKLTVVDRYEYETFVCIEFLGNYKLDIKSHNGFFSI